MPSPYWEAQTQGFRQGLGNLAQAFARMPINVAQGQMMNARAGEYGAMAGEANARSGLIAAQTAGEQANTADLMKKGMLVDALQKSAPMAMRAFQAGKLDDPSIDDFTGAAAALTGQNKGDIQKSMATGLGTLFAAGGNVSKAAAVENPVSVNNNAADNAVKANRPVIVPTGGTLTAPDGTPLSTGGVTLSPGQTRFAPQGNLTAGMMQAGGPTPDDMENALVGGTQLPNTTDTAPVVASVPPLPPKPGAPAKPTTPPLQSPGVLAQIFKQNLQNSQGGTNTDQAVEATLRQTGALPAASAGSGAANAAAPGKLPTVATQDDYEALAPGTPYVGPDGRRYIKKGK